MDIVWIHGFGEDSTVWENLIPEIYTYYSSHLFDFSARTNYASITEYANDLRKFILENKIEKPVLIGHSMGGYIALEYASLFNNDISGLGLFHSTAASDSEEKKLERDKTAAFITANGSEAFISNFYPKMFTENFRKKEYELIQENTSRFIHLNPEALVAATVSMKNRKSHLETISTFDFPVFQILGKQDTFVALESALAQTLTIKKPNVLVLDNVAHAGMFENLEICSQFINNYLENF